MTVPSRPSTPALPAMRVAIADDEEATRLLLTDLLSRHGYICAAFRNGRDLLAALQRDTFDLIIVDWSMPEPNGLEIIRWARANLESCPPIIMLTNHAGTDDVVTCLNAGADDYIVKPELPHVIMARANAVMRRSAHTKPQEGRFERFGAYAFDRLQETVTFGDDDVRLTSREFALARLLFQNLHRALSRAYIMETLWNSAADLHTRTLDMHISRVRAKLRLRPENGYRLLPVFSYGYRLETFEPAG